MKPWAIVLVAICGVVIMYLIIVAGVLLYKLYKNLYDNNT